MDDGLKKIGFNLRQTQQQLGAPDSPIELRVTQSLNIEKIEDLEQMLQNTKLVGGIWTDKNGPYVLHCKNQVSSLHGRERVRKEGEIWESEYRYHICQCRTIDGFLRSHQLDGRYTKFYPGYGRIPYATVDGEEHRIKMHVCQNCLERIGYKGFERNVRGSEEKRNIWLGFDVIEYIKEKGFLDLPNVRGSIGNGQYPGNWPEISKRMRERIPYCEFCESNENLQVHHIDANPSNCIDNNLMVLCKNCHERLHSGKKLTIQEEKKIEERRRGIFPQGW